MFDLNILNFLAKISSVLDERSLFEKGTEIDWESLAKFFDLYDEIVNKKLEENLVDKITGKAYEYELFLKKVYSIFFAYIIYDCMNRKTVVTHKT